MKRVLIVSPHFPPINAPDMQRVRMSLPYYRAAGWEPVVLAVSPDRVEGVVEAELLATVPAEVRVIRCSAMAVRWTRRIGLGSLALRSLRALDRAGSKLLTQEAYDLVFFSNTQFMTFTLGPRWQRRFGVPYVIDIQDPWRTDYYERKGSRKPPGGWKYQFARLQARLFEGPTYRGAAGLMSVSGHYLDDVRQRYPAFASPTTVIPFGASRADLDAARSGPASPHAFLRRPGELHVVYTGASGPVTPHALTVLFDGLREHRKNAPDRAARLRLHFFGTSYVAPGQGNESVVPLARACGVADLVDEVPHRLGHLESIRLQSEADVLLLPGSSDLAYSPSKIYPYFLSGKPILGLVFRDSVLERVLDELNCAHLVRFREHEPKADAHAGIARFFDLALEGFRSGALPARHEKFFNECYLAESLTARQCALFEQAVSRGASRPPTGTTSATS